MKKIDYQAPVIKTLTMEYIMAGASGATATEDGTPIINYGGVDEGGEIDPNAKFYGTHSVWDD